MIFGCPILALATVAGRQAAYLPRFWVAEKSAYVLEDSKSDNIFVRRFVETSAGIRQAGSPIRIKDFVVGSGPGLGDSLLLLCRKTEKIYQVVRVANGLVKPVCSLRHFSSRIDPQITLRETNECIVVEDPTTQGDDLNLRIWLYSTAWAGPLLTNYLDARSPVNSRESVKSAAYGWTKQGDRMWNIDDQNPTRNRVGDFWIVPEKIVVQGNKTVDDLVPVQSMAEGWLSFVVQSGDDSWIIRFGPTYRSYPSCKLDLWQESGPSQLHDLWTKGSPTFSDSRGRFWVYRSDHVFHRLELRHVRQENLKFGYSYVLESEKMK